MSWLAVAGARDRLKPGPRRMREPGASRAPSSFAGSWRNWPAAACGWTSCRCLTPRRRGGARSPDARA